MPACGVDISDRAIKYIELKPGNKQNQFLPVRFGEELLNPGVVVKGAIKDPDAFIEVLRKINNAGISFCYVSIPEEKGYVAEFSIPRVASNYMRETVQLHLDEYIPIEASSAVFDYTQVVDSDRNMGVDELIVVAATEYAFAQEFAKTFQKADIIPLGFELESQAMSRAVIGRGERSTNAIAIIDIGREESNVSIVVNGVVRLASSVGIGGNVISRAIISDLSSDEETAIQLKEKIGLLRRSGESQYASIVRAITPLRDEIREIIVYWHKTHSTPNAKVSKVLLCGGNASIPGMVEFISLGLGLPVNIANPWANSFSIDDYVPEIAWSSALKYCTAIGLALRGGENS